MHWRTAVNLLSLLILCWLPNAWMQDQFELRQYCSPVRVRMCEKGPYEFCRSCLNAKKWDMP